MTKVDPVVPGEGNTITSPSSGKKQISPSKRWCFTLNNYTSDETDEILEVFEKKSKLYIIGDEIGSSETPHLQGYVEFNEKYRPVSLFNNKRIHWEKAKGNQESNIKYCSKEKILKSKGVKIKKPLKLITDLYPWQQEIKDFVLNTEPDDRTVHWYWESEGGFGKTQFIRYMCAKYNALFCSGGGKTPSGILLM